MGDDLFQTEGGNVQSHPFRPDSGQRQNVVDELQEHLRIALDLLQGLSVLYRNIPKNPSLIRSAFPIITFRGVRSSWDIAARNSDFARLASTISRLAPSNSTVFCLTSAKRFAF